MNLNTLNRIAAVVALTLAGSGVALACNVGDIQCDNAGYRYVCQCWTTDGCQYYSDGTCTADHSPPKPTLLQKIGLRGRPIPQLATPVPPNPLDSLLQAP